jgi:hypothetical protein
MTLPHLNLPISQRLVGRLVNSSMFAQAAMHRRLKRSTSADGLSLNAANLRTTWSHGALNRLIQDGEDNGRCGNDWRVISFMDAHLRLHPFRHETLIVFDDHAVLLRNKKPARNLPPEWLPDGDRNTLA